MNRNNKILRSIAILPQKNQKNNFNRTVVEIVVSYRGCCSKTGPGSTNNLKVPHGEGQLQKTNLTTARRYWTTVENRRRKLGVLILESDPEPSDPSQVFQIE